LKKLPAVNYTSRDREYFILGSGILGALSVIFGGVLIANYSAPSMVITLVWVVAVLALIGGIGQIVQAFMQRA